MYDRATVNRTTVNYYLNNSDPEWVPNWYPKKAVFLDILRDVEM